MIERQVLHLSRLVDDLLDVSRITRGKITLRKEVVDLAAVLSRAVETSRPLIEANRHRLTLSLFAQPIRLVADPTRLEQVFSNLLNNAAKYMERGGAIWLSGQRLDGEVVVRVRDTGFGIPAEVLPRIFDLFAQADRTLDRSQGGLGIGLTLVRSLVEMQGGSVEAHSEGPGKGSEFVVRLPLHQDSGVRGQESGGSLTPDSYPPTPSLVVLVVDDHGDVAESLAMLLRLWGHEVHTAPDGLSGLKAARGHRPQVVLLDIGLPGMDGYEVARRLREEFGPGMQLVALTGYGQEEDRQKSQAAGFDAHLVKPADPAVLRAFLAGVQGGRVV
jgi:CheY-like chemotaxis protein/two-component sensor histidine kinase